MNDFSRKLYFFGVAAIQAVFLLPSHPSDFGLRGAWEHGGVSPYSVLWFAINPLYWTQLPYKLWCLSLIAVMSVVYWKLYRRGNLGYGLILAWQLQNAVWWSFSNTQNITVTLLAPLAFAWWPFAVWPMLVKVPWGWSWNLSDVHWHCAFRWPGNWTTSYIECSSFNRWGLNGGLIYLYLMIGLWAVVPVLWGVYCGRKK